jgi:hypothetical protein
VRSYVARHYQQVFVSHHISLSAGNASQLADCVLKRLHSEGINTYGDANKANRALALTAEQVCAK